MTAPLIGPARAFDLAVSDLQAVSDRLATFHDECWHPRQPDHDRPTPTRPPDADPDHVPGAVRDCGLGDEQAREGWKRMVGHLSEAERQTTDVLCAAVGLTARPVSSRRPTSLLDAQSSVRRLQKRLSALKRLWGQWAGVDEATPTWQMSVPNAQWLARQLMGERGHPQFSPFWHLEQARYEAQRVVAIVGNGKPPPMCVKCRKVGSVGQPRRAGWCEACLSTKWRLKRRERQHAARNVRGT